MKKREISDVMVERMLSAPVSVNGVIDSRWRVRDYLGPESARHALEAALNPDRRKGERRSERGVSPAKPQDLGVEGRAPSGARKSGWIDGRCIWCGARETESCRQFGDLPFGESCPKISGISRPSPTEEIPVSETMGNVGMAAGENFSSIRDEINATHCRAIYTAMEAQRRLEGSGE